MIRISTPNKVISRVCYDAIPYALCYEVHIPCRVRSDCEFNEDSKPCNILVKVQLRVPQIQKGSIHSALVSFGEFWSGKPRSGILRYQTRNFQKFSSDDSNESLQSSSPSLTGFNIQASLKKNVTSEVGKAPSENRPGPAPPPPPPPPPHDVKWRIYL